MSNEDINDVLSDLVLINNDRIQGYERAAHDIEDPQLADLFRNLTSLSRRFRSDLADVIVRSHGTVPDTSETSSGSNWHRAWIDIKAFFTGKDRNAILDSCVFGEDAAIAEYEEVLKQEHLPAYIRDTLTHHLSELRQTREQVARMREIS
ncbi:ferritin-like domain-containing protein [Tellurirhabdus rosea]|uniref:ferritin-like domain-containing protein n=1 Tax=Tellurirhabdus rosea TaxID=2674997 RepID=UPI00224ED682|nr:PA2169 family four-helix-bundle protein [Tellurirhabdus rosea]